MLTIVFQAMVAVADSMDMHVYDPQHAQTEHKHSDDNLLQPVLGGENISNPTEHDVTDCHHCGHCSGTHLNWLSGLINTPSPILTKNQIFDSPVAHLPGWTSELLRPPIS
jgi:hypothetical protein